MTLTDAFTIFGAIQGIGLSIAILKIPSPNPAANRWLTTLLSIMTIMLLGRIAFLNYYQINLYRISITLDCIIFLFGPTSWTYLYQLTKHQQPPLLWAHLLPVVIFLISISPMLFQTPESFHQRAAVGQYNLAFGIIEGGGISSAAIYLFLCYRLIKNYSQNQKNNFTHHQLTLKFIWAYLLSLSFCLIVWTGAFLAQKIWQYHHPLFTYDYVWIAIAIFTYLIGYYSLTHPELLRQQTLIKEQPPNQQPRLNLSKINTIKQKLIETLETQKQYREDLSLSQLSKNIDESANDVSWVLNNSFKKSFYQYINHLRVQEFISKIENGEHEKKTILALSLEVGFKSKSTFNKSFKEETNYSPSHYIKHQNNTQKVYG